MTSEGFKLRPISRRHSSTQYENWPFFQHFVAGFQRGMLQCSRDEVNGNGSRCQAREIVERSYNNSAYHHMYEEMT